MKTEMNINMESENGSLEGEITFGKKDKQVPCEFSWLQYFGTTCRGKHYMPGAWLFARFSEATKKTEFENEKNGLPKNNWINTVARRNPYKFMCKTVTSHYVVLFPWFLLHPFGHCRIFYPAKSTAAPTALRTPGPFGCTCVSWWASSLHFAAWRFEEVLRYGFDRKTIFKWWKTLKKPVTTTIHL